MANLKHFMTTNLNVGPEVYPDNPRFKVHRGFLKQWLRHKRNMWPALKTALQVARQNPDYRIYLVGYSLGGGIAPIAAADIMSEFGPDVARHITIATFGAPRPGTGGFAKFVDGADQILRIVFSGDVIPRLPGQFQGFRHPGDEYWSSRYGELKKWCEGDNNHACSDSTFGSFADHMEYILKNYVTQCGFENRYPPSNLNQGFSTLQRVTADRPVPWTKKASIFSVFGITPSS